MVSLKTYGMSVFSDDNPKDPPVPKVLENEKSDLWTVCYNDETGEFVSINFESAESVELFVEQAEEFKIKPGSLQVHPPNTNLTWQELQQAVEKEREERRRELFGE